MAFFNLSCVCHETRENMGGDGGSIPKRVDIVKDYQKKRIYEDPSSTEINRWTNCTISETPLDFPVVVDFLGNLYSKAAVVDYLIKKKTMETKQNTHLLYLHLNSLKDVWQVKATEEDGRKNASKLANTEKSDTLGRRTHRFVCPITGLPANGKYRFIVMRHCGCMLSQRAFDEVPSSTCLICQAPLDSLSFEASISPERYQHCIPVNPAIEEQEILRDLFALVRQHRKEKKGNAAKKRKEKEETCASADKQKAKTDEGNRIKKKRKVQKLPPQKPGAPEPSKEWRKKDFRFQDPVFASMFMSDEEAAKRKADPISTKPVSCMSIL
eukprot:g45001.t1